MASFFFFSPFSLIEISRSREIAKSRATVGVVEVEKVEKVDMGRSERRRESIRAWDPSTSHDSSHGETRVGRAGLRIEGKNDDTDVNL